MILPAAGRAALQPHATREVAPGLVSTCTLSTQDETQKPRTLLMMAIREVLLIRGKSLVDDLGYAGYFVGWDFGRKEEVGSNG